MPRLRYLLDLCELKVSRIPITMSRLTREIEAKKKRKRDSVVLPETKGAKRRVNEEGSDLGTDIQSEILLLENQILESREHYNSIVTLLDYSKIHDAGDQREIASAVALCRILCRLIAAGSLDASRNLADNEVTIVHWLQKRLVDYETSMLCMLVCQDISKQVTAMTLLMRLTKAQAENLRLQEDAVWLHGIFKKILRSLVDNSPSDEKRAEFVEKYLVKYDDIRYYTFTLLP